MPAARRTRGRGLLAPAMRRWAFWSYAAMIFVLTHWPKLDVRVRGIERPDLLAHFAVFGLWAVLLAGAEYFGRIASPRNLALTWLAATIYTCIDEGLQLIPALGRHAAWDDLAANIGGVTIGTAIAGLWAWWRRTRAGAVYREGGSAG